MTRLWRVFPASAAVRSSFLVELGPVSAVFENIEDRFQAVPQFGSVSTEVEMSTQTSIGSLRAGSSTSPLGRSLEMAS